MTISKCDFDEKWYVSAYPELKLDEDNAFNHYMEYGRFMGYRPYELYKSIPLDSARLICRKDFVLKGNIVLLVSHVIDYRIKPHVIYFAEYLRSKGFFVIGVLACDAIDSFNSGVYEDNFDGLYVRENIGYDFAAWAHVLRSCDLTGVNSLILTNDSILGPLSSARMDECLLRIFDSPSLFFGMTDNWEHCHHSQSYFTLIKREGFDTLMGFMAEVQNIEEKSAVILSYELRMLSYFNEKGIDCEILFPTDSKKSNPTLHNWEKLIKIGYPFIKMEVLRTVAAERWFNAVTGQGYPERIIHESLNEAGLYRPIMEKRASLKKVAFHRFVQFTFGLFSRKIWARHSELATSMRVVGSNDTFIDSIWGTWCPLD